jgi:hypothetical protein
LRQRWVAVNDLGPILIDIEVVPAMGLGIHLRRTSIVFGGSVD